MARFKNLFTNSAGVRAAVTWNDGNQHLLEKQGNPLAFGPLSYLQYSLQHLNDAPAYYLLSLRQDRLITGGAVLLAYKKDDVMHGTAHGGIAKEDTLYLDSLSVRADHRRLGVATACMTEVFARTQKLGVLLALSELQPSGMKFHIKTMPGLHARFPDVRVKYPFQADAVTAERPYRIVLDKEDFSPALA